jgi:hypothetical protein
MGDRDLPMNDLDPTRPRARFFGPLPTTGVWTSLGLTRGQFLGILVLSCAVFLFWGGPLWLHSGGRDFPRLTTSYAVIPFGVLAAQLRNRSFRLPLFAAASAVIAVLKLVLTAGLDLAIGIAARGGPVR